MFPGLDLYYAQILHNPLTPAGEELDHLHHDLPVDDVFVDGVSVDGVSVDDVSVDDLSVGDLSVDDVSADDVSVDGLPEVCKYVPVSSLWKRSKRALTYARKKQSPS